ncbi:unnamed protein product (macronuclear) [Paramecium tetraurelia]|uniref:Uncharacterized protein n=1 Tax=Paramecium tetraurelia TaxID=5888 RepID=A0C9X7_PARTE|nr:uncharacterized protein GSPATT00006901001 [Paramecium tetraurelia]CAK67594.1 unnamed protein product [Paramecium tetraurelia]|eukprot:XP_001434991.1 hypothetical protein (macronuclear) [Paramecium tetraurelia strain d4-2]
MFNDSIDIQTQQKDQQNIPSQYPYLVYNFPSTSLMEYNNSQIPQLQIKNSNDSLFKENMQIPGFFQGISVPSFQFNNSNQFYLNEQKPPLVPSMANALASVFNEQQKSSLQNDNKSNRIIIGTQTLCNIEMIFVQRYFDIKNQIFCHPNMKYTLNEDRSISNSAWLKDRIKNRYKKPVSYTFDKVDQGIYVRFNRYFS